MNRFCIESASSNTIHCSGIRGFVNFANGCNLLITHSPPVCWSTFLETSFLTTVSLAQWNIRYLYNSVIFEGATLVYRPDCNAEGGCHANSARAKRGRYWLWQPPEALQEGRYTSVAPEQNHAIIIITTWSDNALSFYKLFACGSVPCGALIVSQMLFVSHDRVDRSSLACARTWERTPPNNGHHVMCSSNQREVFLIAPATTATPISP